MFSSHSSGKLSYLLPMVGTKHCLRHLEMDEEYFLYEKVFTSHKGGKDMFDLLILFLGGRQILEQ